MNLLTPVAGVILAAAVIPPLILLYFLKLRRRTQPIGSTLLWTRSVEDLRANAPFQRLRRSLLLLLQLLALVLLALALMQPQLQAGTQRGGKTVLLIDTSASMSATDVDDGRTRLEEARRLARARIEAIYAGGLFTASPGETMVIAFSDAEHAEVMARFTDSRQKLLTAIDRIRPTHGGTSLAQALTLSRAYATNVDPEQLGRLIQDAARLELFSDGRIHDLAEQVLRQEELRFHPVGTAGADNAGIVSVSVERPYDRPGAVEVFTALRNYTPIDVTLDVQLSVDDVAVYVESITLPAAQTEPGGRLDPGRNNLVFTPFEQPRSAVIEVALLRRDDLAADNTAHAVVPPPRQLDVALVADRGDVVTMVLEGMPLSSLRQLPPGRYETLAREGGLEAFDVIIFNDYAPPSADLMPPGRYLCLGRTPPLPGFNEYGEGGRQVVLTARTEHPVMRFVALDNLYIGNSRLLQPDDDMQVLAEGTSGPVIVSASRGPMQVLFVTFSPLDSTWPYQRSFVIFMLNAVEALGHSGAALTSRGYEPGEAITARVPPNAVDARMLTPAGESEAVAVGDGGAVTWGPTRLAGLHLLTWSEPEAEAPSARPFACNMLSEAEGDIAATEVIRIGQDEIDGRAAGGQVYTPLWPWALGVCLALLMFEWWVYHRLTYV